MPAPLDPARREEIAQAIRDGAGTRSRNSIAREHNVSPSTVSKIAEEAGIENPFDRTLLARACEAKTVDNRARRAQLAEDHLSDAIRLRERIWQPASVVTPQGEVVVIELPNAQDVRHFMSAVGQAIKVSMEVERHDAADGTASSAVDAWLRDVLGGGA